VAGRTNPVPGAWLDFENFLGRAPGVLPATSKSSVQMARLYRITAAVLWRHGVSFDGSRFLGLELGAPTASNERNQHADPIAYPKSGDRRIQFAAARSAAAVKLTVARRAG